MYVCAADVAPSFLFSNPRNLRFRVPYSGKAYVCGLIGGLGHALDVERVDGKYWNVLDVGVGDIGKFGEEVGRLGGLEIGGTRAEHWPKDKEYLPRQESHIVICEGRINITSKEQLSMVLMVL